MRKAVILLTLIPALVFFHSCKQKETEQDKPVETESAPTGIKETAAFGTVNGDTIHLSGKFVLFYGPDENSFTSKQLLADSLKYFRELVLSLQDSLKQHTDINTLYSTAEYFKIENRSGSVMTIGKSALKLPTGIMAGDGLQAPAIKTGVHSADESYAFLKKFFFLK